ncbi:hypothetical protein ACF1DV_32695 [Streptomyces achromogenes]|uniref:hypothetical protein n=1 Tax=Streptomyces achromogenes TaxID=67255 RepID=UPI0036F75D5E
MAMICNVSLSHLAPHQVSYVTYTTTALSSLCLTRDATSDMYFVSEAEASRGPYHSCCPNDTNRLGKLHARATVGAGRKDRFPPARAADQQPPTPVARRSVDQGIPKTRTPDVDLANRLDVDAPRGAGGVTPGVFLVRRCCRRRP